MGLKDELLKPFAISEENSDVLHNLPIDWIHIYQKFTLMLCLQYPPAMLFCFVLYCFRETEVVVAIPILHAKAKYFAIGYWVLWLFITLIEISMVKKQTRIYFEHWQKERDFKNIEIVNRHRDWYRLGFKTGLQYSCPSLSRVTFALFLITLLPYVVAGIIAGNKEVCLGFLVCGFYVASWTCGYMYPVPLALDEGILNVWMSHNQV